MALNAIRGPGETYDPNPLFSGQSGITIGTQIGTFNKVSLPAGATYLVPAGSYNVLCGPYTFLQFKDPITGRFGATIHQQPSTTKQLYSDGQNVRIANLTGCPVGALITTVGSGYTNSTVGTNGSLDTSSSPTITVSTGGSTWVAIVGGAVSGTVTITTAGATYNYPPQLIVANPPPGGVQCTMTCTVSAGAINAVTVVNQGAGYQVAPQVVVVPDARDLSGQAVNVATPAVLTTALTGSGVVTAVIPTNHGSAVTAVPTLTFSSGSAAATVSMAFTCTAVTFSNAGVAYGNAQPYLVTIAGGIVAGTAGTVVNPQLSTKMFAPRVGFGTGTSEAGGTLVAAPILDDGGLYQRVPNVFVTASGTSALPTTTAIAAATVGGSTDTFWLQQI